MVSNSLMWEIWIRDALKHAQMSQAALSRELTRTLGRSIDKAAVNKMTMGKRNISADEMLAIERITGHPISEENRPNSPPYAPNAVIGQPIDSLPTRALPVYGKAVGGTNGEFIMNGERTGLIPCPPQLLMVADAYAVEVRGDSMEPRYFDGETVVVNPERMPVKGDFVVVQIESDPSGPPHAFVKRFVRWTPESIVLEQYNPSTTLEFPSDQVVSVHYILTGRDLQG